MFSFLEELKENNDHYKDCSSQILDAYYDRLFDADQHMVFNDSEGDPDVVNYKEKLMYDIVKLQRSYVLITEEKYQHEISILHYDLGYLNKYHAHSFNDSPEKVLYNFSVSINDMRTYEDIIVRETKDLTTNKMVISGVLLFSHSVFCFFKEIPSSLVAYLSNKDYICDSKLEFDNYDTPVKVLKKIKGKNPTLEIDIEGYEKVQQKQLEEMSNK